MANVKRFYKQREKLYNELAKVSAQILMIEYQVDLEDDPYSVIDDYVSAWITEPIEELIVDELSESVDL